MPVGFLIIALLSLTAVGLMMAEGDAATTTPTADDQSQGGAQHDGQGEGGDDSGQTDTSNLLAGKYESVDKLKEGIRNLDENIDPEQVSSTDALEQMYKALERRQGRQKSQQQQAGQQGQQTQGQDQQQSTSLGLQEQGGQDDQQQQQGQQGPIESVDQAVQAAGLDMQTLEQQLQQSGDLTEAQYQALQNATGFGRGFIQDMARSKMAEAQVQQQQAQQLVQTAVETAGGEQQLRTLQQWAANNLSQDEQNWFNNQVDGQNANKASVEAAFSWLKNRHQQAVGASGSQGIVSGQGASTSEASPIEGRDDYFRTVRLANNGSQQAQERLKQHRRAGGKRFY